MEHEARLEGTVIDVGVFGKIGVDQACSGINGLQASLVVTPFPRSILSLWLDPSDRTRRCRHLGRSRLQPWASLLLSFLKVKERGIIWMTPSFHSPAGLPPPCTIWLVGSRPSLSLLRFYLLTRMAKGGLFLSTLANGPTVDSTCAVLPTQSLVYYLSSL